MSDKINFAVTLKKLICTLQKYKTNYDIDNIKKLFINNTAILKENDLLNTVINKLIFLSEKDISTEEADDFVEIISRYWFNLIEESKFYIVFYGEHENFLTLTHCLEKNKTADIDYIDIDIPHTPVFSNDTYPVAIYDNKGSAILKTKEKPIYLDYIYLPFDSFLKTTLFNDFQSKKPRDIASPISYILINILIENTILPGDITSKFQIKPGVTGSTSMSINRRLMDARFSSRWLVGNGLDIGGGPDSIGIYKSLFPLMGTVTVYDIPQGDAQYLDNVGDNSFDFVYSAHCLEHVVDPMVAINNWMRVLKPNGHLIITVPDEDMYEQGVWPSTYNPDHKHTFTILKKNSWSPVSINILSLIQNITVHHAIQKIELLNHSYLEGLPRFPQTYTPFAESGIEIVIKKMTHSLS